MLLQGEVDDDSNQEYSAADRQSQSKNMGHTRRIQLPDWSFWPEIQAQNSSRLHIAPGNPGRQAYTLDLFQFQHADSEPHHSVGSSETSSFRLCCAILVLRLVQAQGGQKRFHQAEACHSSSTTEKKSVWNIQSILLRCSKWRYEPRSWFEWIRSDKWPQAASRDWRRIREFQDLKME